ncbi:hypothetical protein ACFL9U_07785 [Thermodesulfobacteriota bacterium]
MQTSPANSKTQGTTELGTPLLMFAIIGGIALSGAWDNIPTWGRVVSIGVIGIFVVGGFISLGQPSGMASRALEQEIKDRVEKDRTESKKEGEATKTAGSGD